MRTVSGGRIRAKRVRVAACLDCGVPQGAVVEVKGGRCFACKSESLATFDSKAEANRWFMLRQDELAGKITDLERQPSFTLAEARFSVGNRAIRYVADFKYRPADNRGLLIIEDVKGGAITPEAKVKLAWLADMLWRQRVNFRLRIVGGGGTIKWEAGSHA